MQCDIIDKEDLKAVARMLSKRVYEEDPSSRATVNQIQKYKALTDMTKRFHEEYLKQR